MSGVRPAAPDPNAFSLRPVLKGEPYSRAVEGGVRRTPAPLDGVVVVLVDREVFIPQDDLGVILGSVTVRRYDRQIAAPSLGKRR